MPQQEPSFIFTKIIATVGPASESVGTLVRLIDEGVRVFRINFSHGGFNDFERILEHLRDAGRRSGEPVAALGDICGPKIRVGQVQDGGIELKVGDRVEFQCQTIVARHDADDPDDPIVFSTTFGSMIQDVQPGQRLFIDDGAIRMLVIDHVGQGDTGRLICQVTAGGAVSSHKGINLPETDLRAPSLTDYDWRCVDWAIRNELDYLALSFVRRADDVRQLKTYLAQKFDEGGAIPVIAKIEKPQALDDLDAIVLASDGVMVARGDLGVEMDLARVPVIQKRIITMAHDYGKPVIVATQMLQSMIDAPTPTRAEASDVANAIFDGADAVMLSGETAVGKYPLPTAHTMARIALASEAHMRLTSEQGARPPRKLQETRYRTAALAHGVSVIVRDLDARLVVIWSQLGGGARYLSQNRMSVPIIAASSNPAALRRMGLLFGVFPVLMEQPADSRQFVLEVDRLILHRGWSKPGDPVLLVMGEPLGTPGVTNELRIHYVGDVCRVDKA